MRSGANEWFGCRRDQGNRAVERVLPLVPAVSPTVPSRRGCFGGLVSSVGEVRVVRSRVGCSRRGSGHGGAEGIHALSGIRPSFNGGWWGNPPST